MTLAEINVGSLFRRYQRLAGICTDPNPDAARFTHLYRLPLVRDAMGRLTHARWAARRLRQLANHTSTAPARSRRDTHEADRLKLAYAQVVNNQRDEIYALRNAILHGIRPPRHTEQILVDLVAGTVSRYCPTTAPSAAWDLPGLCASLAQMYATRLDPDELAALNVDQAMVAAASRRDAEQAYADRVTGLGVEVFAEIERQIELNVIDRCWRQHLAELAELMHTIESMDNDSHLRLYQLGAAAAYQKMRNTIARETIQYVFHLEVEAKEA
jgi:preprotein translocase subunit SecA